MNVGNAEKIILVEDETLNIVYMKLQLRQLGYSIAATLATGEEAVDYLRREDADLLLIDINLGGKMNGIEAVRRIKESRGVPVIFLTGYPDAAIREQADALGPVAILVKPVDMKELGRLMNGLLRRPGAGGE